ncbi:MAG: type II toxin-antitoxin system PemK/MazF family toxin [Bdellovibrionales bacterium]
MKDIAKFDDWSALKKRLNAKKPIPPYWKDRDIWWASIGYNIGHEQNGKHELFERPVVVIRKFNARLFWGVPLTTQIKTNPYYFQFEFKNRMQCAMITQLRLFDANRMIRKLGRMSKSDFQELKNAIKVCL